MNQTIAVVILNWNGLDLLKEFLPKVVKYSEEATVYVADNASTDTSVSFVKANFPEVKIIQNSVNGGYAKGYNDALAGLSEDIFILLNSDVKVTPNWIAPIKAVFQKDPDIAAVQPKILDYKAPSYFEYAGAAGGFIDKFGYP
ncbi:MAG TPA: glycosyltransferase, partial [Gillisia sp.]|nr:glycosyltransferase [Gillisia sp.]